MSSRGFQREHKSMTGVRLRNRMKCSWNRITNCCHVGGSNCNRQNRIIPIACTQIAVLILSPVAPNLMPTPNLSVFSFFPFFAAKTHFLRDCFQKWRNWYRFHYVAQLYFPVPPTNLKFNCPEEMNQFAIFSETSHFPYLRKF